MQRIIALFALLGLFAFAGSAQAATVANLGELNVGDHGEFDYTSAVSDDIYGQLADGATVDFFYTITLPSGAGIRAEGIEAALDYGDGDLSNRVSVSAFDEGETAAYEDSVMKLLASLSQGALSAETSFTNTTGGLARIVSSLTLFLTRGYVASVHVAYNVVPLPAALPLFGLGLAGLAAVKRRRKVAA